MTTLPRTALRSLTLAAALCAAGLLSADEPVRTYDLHTWDLTWKAGDVCTLRVEGTKSGSVVADITDPNTGETAKQTHDVGEHEAYGYVQRCEAANEQGRPSKFRVFVSAWLMAKAGQTPDESLTGAHLEVTVTGGTWTWKHLNPREQLSEEATSWLEKRFGAERTGEAGLDLGRMGRPEGPVKVGATWAGRVDFIDKDAPVDVERSKVEVRLAGVENGIAHVAATYRIQLRGFPMGEGDDALIPWSEGGAFEGQGEEKRSLAPHSFDAKASLSGTARGTAKFPGGVVSLDMKMSGTMTSTTGGVIPELVPSDPPVTIDPPR